MYQLRQHPRIATTEAAVASLPIPWYGQCNAHKSGKVEDIKQTIRLQISGPANPGCVGSKGCNHRSLGSRVGSFRRRSHSGRAAVPCCQSLARILLRLLGLSPSIARPHARRRAPLDAPTGTARKSRRRRRASGPHAVVFRIHQQGTTVTSIQRERAQMGKPHVSGFLITAPYIRSVLRLLAFSTFEDDLVVLSPPPFASTEDGDRRLERLGRVAGRWGGRHELRRAVASMVRACGSGRTWRRGNSPAAGRRRLGCSMPWLSKIPFDEK